MNLSRMISLLWPKKRGKRVSDISEIPRDGDDREWRRTIRSPQMKYNLNYSEFRSMERHKDLISYSYADLQLFTDNFSESNFLGNTQFGKLYRGKIPPNLYQNQAAEDKIVTVKIWVDHSRYLHRVIREDLSLMDEVYLLKHPSMYGHPNLPRLIGGCHISLQEVGAVYDLNPVDTLHNLILQVSTGFRELRLLLDLLVCLSFFRVIYKSPHMVRNLDAAHVLIDQDFNPILCDFVMLSGGIMGDRINPNEEYIFPIIGYVDPQYVHSGGWWPFRDVYHYGVILLSIIAKRVIDKEHPEGTYVDHWAKKEYQRPKKHSLVSRVIKGKEKYFQKCSLVCESLQGEPGYDVDDGYDITKVGMDCVDFQVTRRPTMKKIVRILESLRVGDSHGDAIGLSKSPAKKYKIFGLCK